MVRVQEGAQPESRADSALLRADDARQGGGPGRLAARGWMGRVSVQGGTQRVFCRLPWQVVRACGLILVAAGLGGGCRARERGAAADAYGAELRAHRARFQAWEERYPGIEARLAEARQNRPEEVVRIVEGELLGLLGELVQGYSAMVRSGRRYVALLPRSVKARDELRDQLDVFQEQQRLMRRILRTYVEEADLFRPGRPDQAALQEVWSRRLDAARQMQKGEGD